MKNETTNQLTNKSTYDNNGNKLIHEDSTGIKSNY
jgi:hypothetical protein